MDEIAEHELYKGVSIELPFPEPGPTFGDIFLLCGTEHPAFPPSRRYKFDQLDDLQFSQVDDYFGVPTQTGEGDDVAVWLYPIVDGDVVDHHPGPFTALRLEYNVLRNPLQRGEHFLRCTERIASLLGTSNPDTNRLRARINAIVLHWNESGIEVGSEAALAIDY